MSKHCPKCNVTNIDNTEFCSKCGGTLEAQKGRGCSIFFWAIIALVITVILVWFSSKSSLDEMKRKDRYAFEQQMQKDPATWNKQEQRRFNAFWKWNNDN